MKKATSLAVLACATTIAWCACVTHAVLPPDNATKYVVISSYSITEENFNITFKLEKREEASDSTYDYYKVTVIAIHKERVANTFGATVALWTASGGRPELVDFDPHDRAPSIVPFTLAIPGGISITLESASPGAWRTKRNDMDETPWLGHRIEWTMLFETRYCWERLETSSEWKVLKTDVKWAGVAASLITASGGCWSKSPRSTSYHCEGYFDITALEKEASE